MNVWYGYELFFISVKIVVFFFKDINDVFFGIIVDIDNIKFFVDLLIKILEWGWFLM